MQITPLRTHALEVKSTLQCCSVIPTNSRTLLVTWLLLKTLNHLLYRSMRLGALQTASNLCAAVKTRVSPAGGKERPGTGEPTASVTCLCGQLRTCWKTQLLPDPGTGSTGPETYRHTTFGLRPGNSSCQSLQSSPGWSTSNFFTALSAQWLFCHILKWIYSPADNFINKAIAYKSRCWNART